MTKYFLTGSLLLFAISTYGATEGTPSCSCAASAYSEAHALSELPAEVRATLQKDRFGLDELVDKNSDFNSTDVGSGPRRRFALAALGSNSILVAIEHGGRGYSVELWVFEQSSNGWRGESQQTLFAVPHSAKELVASICK